MRSLLPDLSGINGGEAKTLRAEDALRLGVSFARLDFSSKIKMDNKVIDVAAIMINAMTVGGITYKLVPGYVARQGALDENFLGHPFIGRLAADHIEMDRITLTGTK